MGLFDLDHRVAAEYICTSTAASRPSEDLRLGVHMPETPEWVAAANAANPEARSLEREVSGEN